MPQPLMERPRENSDPQQEGRLARSTARAFAAAISALLISTLVVSRSGDALETEGTVAGTTFASGTIALVDDDEGRSLFDLSDMAPGRPVERCIQVSYEGSILPVDLSLQAKGEGGLLDYLETSVEEGEGGAFDSCEGFEPEADIFRGDLATLIGEERLALGRILNVGESRSFRVRFDLADSQAALGLTATADFVWEVTPS